MKINYLFFWSDQKAYIFLISHKSDFLEVKLYRIKTSFSTTRMQIVSHVTDERAEEGA